jgi:hypothetical protein
MPYRTMLSQLQNVAKRTPGATVTHTRKQGYLLTLNDQTIPLGKDSVDALFKLEKLLDGTNP